MLIYEMVCTTCTFNMFRQECLINMSLTVFKLIIVHKWYSILKMTLNTLGYIIQSKHLKHDICNTALAYQYIHTNDSCSCTFMYMHMIRLHHK